jgi:uncharacterized protein with PIN domain
MKFMADRTVGKLAKKLRLLGLDVADWREGRVARAAGKAEAEGRILLTRSRRIREEKTGIRIFTVDAEDPGQQTREVLDGLGVEPKPEGYFSRCLRCNEELQVAVKEEVQGTVPDFIYRLYDSFRRCPRCRRIYWPGSHLENMKKDLAKTISGAKTQWPLSGKERGTNTGESAC